MFKMSIFGIYEKVFPNLIFILFYFIILSYFSYLKKIRTIYFIFKERKYIVIRLIIFNYLRNLDL